MTSCPGSPPDGHWIAFTGEYQGNRDVYVIPAGGGTARRLTFTSDLVPEPSARSGPNNMVVTWTPDSKSVVFLSRRMAWNGWMNRLFTVPEAGGMAQVIAARSRRLSQLQARTASRLPTTAFSATSAPGSATTVAWRRTSISSISRATRFLTLRIGPAPRRFPCGMGRRSISCRTTTRTRRENIWAYDTGSHEFRQITHYTDYDIDFPSLGAGADGAAGIVFQQGGKLHVLDVPSEQVHDLDVIVRMTAHALGRAGSMRSRSFREQDTAQHTDYDLAPNGGRIVVSARGDLFTLPAEHGNTRNLTQTSNADEDHPSWSPDGKSVAYTTDVSGEQQVAVRPAEGGAEKILTHFQRGFFYGPRWSPAGDHLAFSDNEHRLWIVATAGGEPQQIAQDAYQEIQSYAWAPDSRWLAYVITGANQQSGIWLYNLETRKSTRVSDPRSNDFNPGFDAAGRYLFFISTRHENPTLSHSEFNIATLKMSGIYVAMLKRGAPSPFAPRSDEGAVGSEDQGEPAGKDGKKGGDGEGTAKSGVAREGRGSKPVVPKPLQIDLDGLTDRAFLYRSRQPKSARSTCATTRCST